MKPRDGENLLPNKNENNDDKNKNNTMYQNVQKNDHVKKSEDKHDTTSQCKA